MVPFLKKYRKALFLRILVFAFLGMGWDVLMTTVQMILGGSLDKSAVMTVSTWMYLVYGSIPLVVYPMERLLLKGKVPRVLGVLFFRRVCLGLFLSCPSSGALELQLVYPKEVEPVQWLCLLSPRDPIVLDALYPAGKKARWDTAVEILQRICYHQRGNKR